MDKFSSVFEIYVALNGAYIVSQDFTAFLNVRVLKAFSITQSLLLQLKELIENNRTSLAIPSDDALGSSLRDEVTRLSKKQKNIEGECESMKESIEGKIKDYGISDNFNLYCFYASLYSFSILILIGFQVDIEHFVGDNCLCFLLVNTLAIVLLYQGIKKKWFDYKIFYNSGFIFTLWMAAVAILLPILLHLIPSPLSIICLAKLLGKCPLNKFVLLVVPCLHFGWYFLKARKNRNLHSKELEKEIENKIDELEDFSKEISTTLGVVKRLSEGQSHTPE